MSKMKDIQKKIEGSIESGINSLESLYASLSKKTFDYAETVEEKAKSITTQDVRDKHDNTVASAFENVRSLNVSANEFVSSLIAKLEKDVEEVVEDVKEAVEQAAEAIEEAAEEVKEAVSEKKETPADEPKKEEA